MFTILLRRFPIPIVLATLFVWYVALSRQAAAQIGAAPQTGGRSKLDDAIKQVSSGSTSSDQPSTAASASTAPQSVTRAGPEKKRSPCRRPSGTEKPTVAPAAEDPAAVGVAATATPNSEQRQDPGTTARELAGGSGHGTAWVNPKRVRVTN